MPSARNILRIGFLVGIAAVFSGAVAPARAADAAQDQTTTVRAKVTDVVTNPPEDMQDVSVSNPDQTITADILEGQSAGQSVSFDNDYVQLKKGDVFFLNTTIHADDQSVSYSVEDPDRIPTLAFFAVLLVVLVLLIGGVQGLRGLLTLAGSFILILAVLLPGILAGYSPVLVTIGVSSLIIIVGSYITHGFNRTTSVAVVSMIATVIVTGILAYVAVHAGRFTGYGTEDALYLSTAVSGRIDMLGLLLGGIMIGLLGVLYDIAISQAVSVEELHRIAPHVSRLAIFKRAMRIGREHIGALVNTLAIAYVGASLPLLLLFSTPPVNVLLTVNKELFSAEIIRIFIGSIGLVLAVPITTFLSALAIVRTAEAKDPAIVEQEAAEIETYEHHH